MEYIWVQSPVLPKFYSWYHKVNLQNLLFINQLFLIFFNQYVYPISLD